MQQRSSLQCERGVSILPEGAGAGPANRRVEQTDIPDRTCFENPHKPQEILQVDVLDPAHTVPRRSITSDHVSIMRLELSCTRAA